MTPDDAAGVAVDALVAVLATSPYADAERMLRDVRERRAVYVGTLLGLLIESEAPIPYRMTVGEDGRIA